jgi:hypothetical protein
VGSCEHSNVSVGSIKGRELLDWLNDLASEELCSMELVSLLVSWFGLVSLVSQSVEFEMDQYVT